VRWRALVPRYRQLSWGFESRIKTQNYNSGGGAGPLSDFNAESRRKHRSARCTKR
jgi:hypothetical protein